jgi:hypothetical protein
MHSGKFRLEATPLFGMELEQAINYVETQLANPEAADKLQTDVEAAVRERLSSPTSFEPVASRVDREQQYYRIYVGNYIVFYCVIGNVMELRRFVYKGRNWKIQI